APGRVTRPPGRSPARPIRERAGGCKLVNRMQTDLKETAFREFVITLAKHFQGAPFDESAFPGD
ncbi:MAG: hypothetical protein WCJ67_12645, partial [Thermoleophilia bacterium]